MRAAFNTAVRWGIISKNVFTQSKPLRVPIKEPAYLTREEFNLLLCSVADVEFRDLLVFAVSTMMRRGEIVNLEWSDIDFERRLIKVRNKEGSTIKGLRPRVVPMSDRVWHLLLKRRKEHGFVFVSRYGRRLKGATISHTFKRHVRECGLSDSLHFHSVRHTGASWLVQQDVPLYSVQRILGHTSPATTQIYSHLSNPDLLRAIERIDFQPSTFGMN